MLRQVSETSSGGSSYRNKFVDHSVKEILNHIGIDHLVQISYRS